MGFASAEVTSAFAGRGKRVRFAGAALFVGVAAATPGAGADELLVFLGSATAVAGESGGGAPKAGGGAFGDPPTAISAVLWRCRLTPKKTHSTSAASPTIHQIAGRNLDLREGGDIKKTDRGVCGPLSGQNVRLASPFNVQNDG
jgi:hypothetical protein